MNLLMEELRTSEFASWLKERNIDLEVVRSMSSALVLERRLDPADEGS